MNRYGIKPEVMAPVGSFESLTAAIKAGCDSVYFGAGQLNMRARSAHNFSLDEMREVAAICREHGVKSYLTMNTLLYPHDLPLMRQYLDVAKEAGITAIIIQDIAAMQYAKQIGHHVHASTQLSISNFESVKFFAQFCDTIVLARELDLEMQADIVRQVHEQDVRGPGGEIVRIEVFVHGALCIAQSGRCQMSLLQNNTSAQRGACLQECRKSYKVIDEETGKEMRIRDGHVLSPKDLCALPFLDQLYDAGIAVYKIEGRGRNPEYVDTVVRVYREAVDALEEGTYTPEKVEAWMERLDRVFHRGFTDGYYLGKALPDWSGDSQNKSSEVRVFAGIATHYFDKAGIAELKIQAHEVAVGDKLVVIGKKTGVEYIDVTEMVRDGVSIQKSERSDLITLPCSFKVRKNDKVYILKKRERNASALPVFNASQAEAVMDADQALAKAQAEAMLDS